MAKKHNRYKDMELKLTAALIADAVIFILYLLFAGLGIIWLKVITAILAILVSGLCLALLYFSGELLRQRSLWMSVGFGAVVICLLFSLILNYPSPNKLKDTDKDQNLGNAVGTVIIVPGAGNIN
ncbi:MAG: hypothetical protein IJX67_04635 [Oscillospiraceae bacterium]|nr:hypothetical protein [Oscillospiraceae bacterium]